MDRKFQTGEYTSWIGPDNKAIGVQDGQFLAEKLPDGGKVAIIKGGPADNSIGLARTDGVKSVLGSAKGVTLVEAPDFGNWGSDGGLTVMESLLATNPDLAAVFCENDAMCLGAQRAIADAGKAKQIIIAGVDGQDEALKAILDGTNYMVTGLNDADIIGSLGLDRAVEILGGAKVEKDTVVPSPQVTKENAAKYLRPQRRFLSRRRAETASQNAAAQGSGPWSTADLDGGRVAVGDATHGRPISEGRFTPAGDAGRVQARAKP